MVRVLGLLLFLSGCIKKAPPPLANTSREIDSGGFISTGLIENEIRRHSPRISHCYEQQIRRNRDVSGRLSVRFVVALDGSVHQLSAKEDTLDSKKLTECVLGVFEQMQFPTGMKTDIVGGGIEPADGTTGVEVVYPLVFSSE